MSTSEQHNNGRAAVVPVPREELTAHQRQVLDGDTTRTTRTVSWVGWHLGELTGISVPAALAVTVNGWFATVSAVVATVWAAHEARTARAQRRLAADGDQHGPAAEDTDDEGEQAHASSADTGEVSA